MIQLKNDIPQSSPLIIAKKFIVQEQLEYIEALNKSKSIINQLYLILRKQQEESRKENEKLQKDLADQISLSDKLLQKLKQQELEKQRVDQKYQIDISELEKKSQMQKEQSMKKIDELIKTIESQKKILQEHESRRIQMIVDNAQSQIVNADELFDKCTQPFQGEIEKELDKVFSMLGVTICYQQIYTHQHIYDNKKQQFKSQITKGIQADAQNLTIQRFESGMDTLQNYFDMDDSKDLGGQTLKSIVIGLKKSICLGKGQQFEKIENYKRWESDEYTDIEHKPGQVLLIEYWSALSDISVSWIKENTTLLKYFAGKWGNKLRVVFLSLVLAEEAQNFMESNKESQKYIEFYFPKEQNQLDQFIYDCLFIPHSVLVDDLGIIRKTGYSYNIEKCFNKLLCKQVSFNKQNQINVQIDPVQFRIFLDTLSEMLKEIDPFKNLDVKIQQQILLVKAPQLIIEVQNQQLQRVLSKIYEIIPEVSWQISKTISKTVSIPYPGNKCSVCNKDIMNEPQQYYSPFKFEHVCNQCAEYDDKEKKGNQRYKYLDTLIFINGPLSDLSVLNNIDDDKIGLNPKLLDGEEGSQIHDMLCNGCYDQNSDNNLEKGPRYISLTTRPGKYLCGNGFIDYCHKCFLQLKNKDSIEAKQIIAKDAQDGMIIDIVLSH